MGYERINLNTLFQQSTFYPIVYYKSPVIGVKDILLRITAQLKQIVAILLVNGARPEADVVKRAEEEGIAILSTKENAFQVSGKVFNLFPGSGN